MMYQYMHTHNPVVTVDDWSRKNSEDDENGRRETQQLSDSGSRDETAVTALLQVGFCVSVVRVFSSHGSVGARVSTGASN